MSFKRYEYIEGLTTLRGGNGKFLINNDGQIKDIKGNDIKVRYDKDGNKVVTCDAWDGTREYRVIDLVAIQFKNLYIPKEKYGDVEAFTIDGIPGNTHASNIGYRFKNGPIEVSERRGFFYIPSMTSCAISRKGDVISVRRGMTSLPYYVSKPNGKRNIRGGYHNFSGYFKSNIKTSGTTSSRHRALCLTFKDYPDNVDSLDVNHINGVPGDDRLENLEWVTRGQNNTHAYTNDLKNQHRRVLVRNARTGEVKEYYSFSEAARQLGLACDEAVRFRVHKAKFGTIFQDGMQFKMKDDPRDWVIHDDVEKLIWEAQEKKGVVVRDCRTLVETVYESSSEAERNIGINSTTIQYRINKGDRSPLFGYQVKSIVDKRPFPDFTEEEFRKSLIPSSFRIELKNLLTGEERVYSSANKAKEIVASTFIKKCLDEDGDFIDENGWCIKKRNGEWPSFSGDIEEHIYKQKKEIMAKHEESRKVYIADSAKQLSEIVGLDPKAIRVAAFTRGNKLYHGYRFRLGISQEPWPTSLV